MTVKEFIKALQETPEEAEVLLPINGFEGDLVFVEVIPTPVPTENNDTGYPSYVDLYVCLSWSNRVG